MALELTLDRVLRDEEHGDLGKARDRLEGLLRVYPDSLEVRRRLGDVYWRLQYPEHAGLHWYLLASDSPVMDVAKQSFEARYGGDASRMLEAIGYHGGLDSLSGTQAEDIVRDLARRAGVTAAGLEATVAKRAPGEPTPSVPLSWRYRLAWKAFLAVVIGIMVLAGIGLITAINSLGALFVR